MKNSKKLFSQLCDSLSAVADSEEAEAMAFRILDHLFGLTKTDVLAGRNVAPDARQIATLEEVISRARRHEPLQYILRQAYFFGRPFHVAPGVLIPRPETELLVSEAIVHATTCAAPRLLDIGTGSGCIAITLALELTSSLVDATDVSPAALEIARQNARALKASVGVMHHDILKQPLPFSTYDVVVSNPPYVTESERTAMRENVVNFEPELALFVPDDDPLIYYRAICKTSFASLRDGGMLAVEINERFGREVAGLFEKTGFSNTTVMKDYGSKDRIVKGIKT